MLKNQKGITLIALIITIIVMMILVVVTINIAINGGIFSKADDAAKQMQIEADKEVLQAEVLAEYNAVIGTIDTEKLKANLNAMGWTINSDGNPFICTSPKGNTFEIALENGNIKIEYKENVATGGGGNQTAGDFELILEQTPNNQEARTAVNITISPENMDVFKQKFTEETNNLKAT